MGSIHICWASRFYEYELHKYEELGHSGSDLKSRPTTIISIRERESNPNFLTRS